VSDATPLASRLRARIRGGGPLSFTDWMDACLYDEAGGFYARGARLGRRGAFSTAPTMHPAFAAAVVAEARAIGAERVLEVGPGDGSLAEALLQAGLDVVLVERAAGMRRLQAERLGDRARWLPNVAAARSFEGLIIANEVLDAVPVRLFSGRTEIRVGLDADEQFCEVPATTGVRRVERPGLAALVGSLAATLRSGRLLLLDYAALPGDPRDPIRTYVGGRQGGSPLRAPGTQDITADVDLEEVRALLVAAGLRLVADETQPAWLRRHGAAVPRPASRSDDDWRLARLLDDALPFHVLSAERP
jgi:SAM-dependent MidA family methyltransferase